MTDGPAGTTPGDPKWRTDQQAYDAGYDEAGADPLKDFPHLVFANAYACGAADRQNQQPRNPAYRRQDYDQRTWERNAPPVAGLETEEE